MGFARKAAAKCDHALGQMVTSAVALEFSTVTFSPSSRHRGSAHVAYARQISMYLMCSVFSLTKQRIADVFGRHSSTVSHACRLIEQDREDPVLDRKLIKLENFLRQAPSSGAMHNGEGRSC